jgi:hypothetical protein
MVGFEYITTWSFPLVPIITLCAGVVLALCLLGLGGYVLKITGLHIPEPWLSVVSIVLGILLLSLFVQVLAMIMLSDSRSLIGLVVIMLPFGWYFLSSRWSSVYNISRSIEIRKFPALIVLSAMLINLLVALAPSTKIDELAYHMLLPSRILNDGALVYYQLPWEGAILPHMFYQIMATPLYALGFLDIPNVLSWFLFGILVWFVSVLMWQQTKNSDIVWWVAAMISVGMYGIVYLITGGSHSYMVLCTTVAVMAVFCRKALLQNISLSTWGVMCSILLLGMVVTKVSLAPMVFFLLLGILWQVIDEGENVLSRTKIIILMLIPWFLIYLPLLIWTWESSGSPFGPLFSDFFIVDSSTFDPLLASIDKQIGARPIYTKIIFLTIVRWSPLIWIGLVGVALSDKLSIRTRILFFALVLFQLVIIILVLPHTARHLGGLQYVIPIVAAIFFGPVLIKKNKYKRFFISIPLLILPWLAVQAYYAMPLMMMPLGIYPKDEFFTKYVPYYNDFIHLDKKLPANAKILAVGTRFDAVYSPRPIYMLKSDFNKDKGPGYLFVAGDNYDISDLDIKAGSLIYENNSAVEKTFRTPGRENKISMLRVYKL